MTINGNGVSASNGVKLLQIVPINIITIVTTIVCAVGLYYKFDARIAALEKSATSTYILDKVTVIEKKVDDNTARSIRVDTNVQWLMTESKRTEMTDKQP